MTQEEKEQLKANLSFGFDLLMKGSIGVLTILMGVIAYQGQRVLHRLDNHDIQIAETKTRLATIEASRYTAADALSDHRLLITEIKDLRQYVDANNPPPWLVKSIDEIKADIKAIRERHP